MISVVIPVKDGGPRFIRCLDSVRSQTLDEDVELVVVDSGSLDGSIEAARARGAYVHEIPPHTFTHGASRNLGASLTTGDMLVFLSQDAVPVGDDWLRQLVRPLRADPTLAGVYGCQLPNEDATPPECYFLGFLYGGQPRRQRASSPEELNMISVFFSNVNSAIRRSVWEQFPFAHDIVMSEDQEWSRRVLLSGYSIAYEPGAAVQHSHNYTMAAAFRRFFDSGVSSSRAYMAGRQHSYRVLRSEAIRYATGEMKWLWRTGHRRWIPYAAMYESTKMLGLLAGANHDRLPLEVKRWMSAIPGIWEAPRDATLDKA